MPNTPKNFFRGAASTTLTTTLYTIPAATTATVTNIVVNNSSGSAGTFTIAFDGVAFAPATAIAAGAIATFDIRQVIAAGKTITGGASAATVNFHISGMETN